MWHLVFQILTRDKEVVGTDPQVACLMDGLTDDYECCHSEYPGTLHKGKGAMYVSGLWDVGAGRFHIMLRKYQTETAATAGSCEAVVLMSGAWKT